jgi:hypothetical protein
MDKCPDVKQPVSPLLRIDGDVPVVVWMFGTR